MSRLMHHLLDEAAARRPDGDAVRCGGDALTWGALATRAHGLAHRLRALGVRRHDRVAVFLAKGLDVSVAFYGVLATGGVLVPIDPKSPPQQIARILDAVDARHVVTEPRRAGALAAALALLAEAGRQPVEQVVGLDADGLDGLVDGLGVTPPACLPWSVLEHASSAPDVRVLEDDASYVLHTSGSTGMPKLIRHTHATARAFVDWAADEYRLTADDRLSNHSSHHTCFATFDYYAAARAAATTVILTPAVMMMPGSLSALLESEGVSVWYSVPTALVQLSLRGLLDERDLGALRWVLFAGETFPPKHLQRLRAQLPAARFSHVYGSTEVNVCTYFHVPSQSTAGGSDPEHEVDPESGGAGLPIGRPCANAEALVVDDELEPVPDGTVGELLIRGATVMSGYWDDDAKNAHALVRIPAPGGFERTFFRTGDRVRWLPSGDLAFGGRADLQVKVRGHRVELEEVEAALLRVDGVDEAVVVTLPDGEGSLALHAAVVVAERLQADPAAADGIVGALRTLLPPHAVPARVAVRDALPRTPTGKVDRRAVRRDATSPDTGETT
ncbi:MAG: amino acid adenylation domain-containing protein [Acidobacteriota bacterium]